MPKFENTPNASTMPVTALDNLRDDIRATLDEAKHPKRRTVGKRFYLSEAEGPERRTVGKRFYLSEAEDQQLEQLRQGVSLSAFVRSKVFGSAIRPRSIVPQLNREAFIHLANLRANCNQIAKAISITTQQNRDLPLTQAYLDQLQRLEVLLTSIGQQLQGCESDREDDR